MIPAHDKALAAMTWAASARGLRAIGAALLLAGSAAVTPTAAAQSTGQGRVIELNRDKMSVYDEHAKFQGKIDKWKLPKDGLKVEAVLTEGYVGVTKDGKRIFLRQAEVTVSGQPGPICEVSRNPAIGQASGRPAISAGAVSSGLGGSAVPCVPK